MRDLPCDDLEAAGKRELSGLARRLVAMAFPGEPVSRALWESRLGVIAEDIPPELRVADWGEPVSLDSLAAYLKSARRLVSNLDQICLEPV